MTGSQPSTARWVKYPDEQWEQFDQGAHLTTWETAQHLAACGTAHVYEGTNTPEQEIERLQAIVRRFEDRFASGVRPGWVSAELGPVRADLRKLGA